MLFDTFCGCVERHLPEYRAVMDEAKLFLFDGAPHDFLKQRKGFHEDFAQDLFAMPFRTVAVEDAGSLVILKDVDDNTVGLHRKRMFIDIMGLDLDDDDFEFHQDLGDEARKVQSELISKFPKGLVVHIGYITSTMINDDMTNLVSVFEAKRGLLVDKKEGIIFDDSESIQLKQRMLPAAQNARVALEELAVLTRKTDFVFETSPAKQPKIKKDSIPRSGQRPLYTILQPHQARKVMQIENPVAGTGKKAVHERRRHLRYYTAGPGKPWKKNMVRIIDAVWIGSSDVTIKKKRYRVRLDL